MLVKRKNCLSWESKTPVAQLIKIETNYFKHISDCDFVMQNLVPLFYVNRSHT